MKLFALLLVAAALYVCRDGAPCICSPGEIGEQIFGRVVHITCVNTRSGKRTFYIAQPGEDHGPHKQ